MKGKGRALNCSPAVGDPCQVHWLHAEEWWHSQTFRNIIGSPPDHSAHDTQLVPTITLECDQQPSTPSAASREIAGGSPSREHAISKITTDLPRDSPEAPCVTDHLSLNSATEHPSYPRLSNSAGRLTVPRTNSMKAPGESVEGFDANSARYGSAVVIHLTSISSCGELECRLASSRASSRSWNLSEFGA